MTTQDSKGMKIEATAIYTYKDVGEILGVGKTTLSKLIKNGHIRYIQLGKEYRFLGESLLADLKILENNL